MESSTTCGNIWFMILYSITIRKYLQKCWFIFRICKFFDTKLQLHEETLEHVKKIFEGRHLKMPDINIGQAMVPEKATPLYNPNGTAPGLFFEQDSKLYFFLPGVPFEMKALVESQVFPVIKNKLQLPEIHNYLLRTTGIAESRLFEKLEPALKKYPDIQVAFHLIQKELIFDL